MAVLFDAGWQGTKVRAVLWFVLAFAGVMAWLAFMEPAVPPPPEIETPAEGLVARIFALAAGAGAVVGMQVYARCYIDRLDQEEDGTLRVRHPALIGSRERLLAPGEVEGSGYRHGQARGGGLTVNAPWLSVRVRGRRLPLVLDVQGDALEPDRLEEVLHLPPGSFYRAPPPPSIPAAPARSLPARKRR